MIRTRSVCFLSSLLCVGVTMTALGHCQSATQDGNWPQWHGPNRDNISTETGLLQQWPESGPPLEWQVQGIGEGVTSVSISNGRICTVGYQADSEYAIALDQQSGQLLWATRIGPAVKENRLMRWLSQRSPTIDEDRVYFLRADGDLICLKADDGVELWRTSYPKDFGAGKPRWGYCDYPLVDGDRLICSPGSADAGVVALNKFDGELIWKVGTSDVKRVVYGYGAIVKANIGGVKQYVTFFRDKVFGVASANGAMLWSYDLPRGRFNTLNTPVVRGNEILVSREKSMALLQILKSEKGFEVREQFLVDSLRLDPFQDNVLVVDDHIYTVPFRGGPICLSRTIGETVWQAEIAQDKSAQNRSRNPRRRGLMATAIYADGNIVVRNSGGQVTLIEASPRRYIEKGSFTIPGYEPSLGSTTPVIAGGRLFLRDDDRIFCYDLRERTNQVRSDPRTIALERLGQKDDRVPLDRGANRSVFVPTPQDIVVKMLQLADVKKSDVVYDLGSGDGRIVITAAKDYGCKAIGYEIDVQLVELSRKKAKQANVEKLVTIEQADLFKVDLKQADVITCFLLPEQLEALLPKLTKLEPGTRIVSHQFEISGIKPDKVVSVDSDEDGEEHKLYAWTAPLKLNKDRNKR